VRACRRSINISVLGDVTGYGSRILACWLLRELVERKLDVVSAHDVQEVRIISEVKDFIASGGAQLCAENAPDKDTAAVTVRLLRKNFRVGRPKRHQKVEYCKFTTLAPSGIRQR
jgi:hypothetical protein